MVTVVEEQRRLLLDNRKVDDVIIVSGHNLGTAEIESAFVAHPKVAEAAVVGSTQYKREWLILLCNIKCR